MRSLVRRKAGSILNLKKDDWYDFDGPRVVAYGVGTDSTAMLIEMVRRKLRVDLILFADVGGEKPHTYAFLPVFDRWLRSHGYPGVTVVEYFTRERRRLTLEQECLERGTLPSLAFGWKSCSLKHKVAPQDKFINHWLPARQAWQDGKKVTKFIGFDCTEGRRCTYGGASPDQKKFIYRYPLIDWGLTRSDCIDIIEKEGLPQPGKSACFFCPAMKKPEIVELAINHPDLFERAIEMEERAQPRLTKVKGLGRRYSWKEFADGNEDIPIRSRVTRNQG